MAERSAAEQLRALVEAAEREAAQSREGLTRVAERADELERRLDELTAGVAEALAALREEVIALRAGGGADPAVDEELIAEAEAAAAKEPEVAPASEEPEIAPASEGPAAPEGARLLALKMALDGRPRDETAAYLRENFELAEPDALLDEVYARAEARK
jgi:hypothetical protein